MDNFIFTQTALKDFEKEYTCPSRWKGLYVDKLWKRTPTLSMLKGSYFEQLFIGRGAGPEIVNDLPRKKNGDKTIDQVRIEQQAQRAKELFDPNNSSWLGFIIKETQLNIKDVDREGTIDILAEDKNVDNWLIDVKLTADLTSTWGDYAWGLGYDNLDLIQLPHYQELYFRKWGFKPRIALFIADYSPKMRIEFNEVVVTDDKLNDYDHRFKVARKIFNEYSESGFPVAPLKSECSVCKLECKSRIL